MNLKFMRRVSEWERGIQQFVIVSDLDKLSSIYDLDLFTLNTSIDSFRELKTKQLKVEMQSSFSVFHNNVSSLNRNLENLQTHLLQELDFHFNVIGVTETKITNSNVHTCNANIPGYVFECVATPLASGGVGLFIDETLSYCVLEKISNEAFQSLWVEISFIKKKMWFAAFYTGSIIHLNAFSNILMKQLKNLLLRENTLSSWVIST